MRFQVSVLFIVVCLFLIVPLHAIEGGGEGARQETLPTPSAPPSRAPLPVETKEENYRNDTGWTRVVSSTPFEPRSNFPFIVFLDKMWVIGGISGEGYKNDVWYSPDGINWAQATPDAGFLPRMGHAAVVFDDKLWIMGGFAKDSNGSVKGAMNDIWYSRDGVTWSPVTSRVPIPPRYYHAMTVFNGRMWVIGGYSGTAGMNDIWYSTDGETWVQATKSAPFSKRSNLNLLVFDNRMWIIGGSNDDGKTSDVWYSSDGITWVQATASAPFTTFAGDAALSTDTLMWVIPDQFGHDASAKGICYSPDGTTWTQLDTPPHSSAERPPGYTIGDGVYYQIHIARMDDRIWVVRRYIDNNNRIKNDVWFTTQQNLRTRPPVAGFVPDTIFGPAPLTVRFTDTSINAPAQWNWNFGDGSVSVEQNPSHTFDAEGNYSVNLTVSSAFGQNSETISIQVDPPLRSGIKWRQATADAPFGPRFTYPSVIFRDMIWIAGGGYFDEYYNDVWCSSDGVNWTLVTPSAAFSPRTGHTFLAFDDKLWVIGGIHERYEGFSKVTDYLNDVWYSEDGVIWNLATPSAAFSPRWGSESVVYDDKMWVLGGRENKSGDPFRNMLNDVWHSADGITWTQATGAAAFSAGEYPVTVAFKNKMWLFNLRSMTVWYSDNGADWIKAADSPFSQMRGGVGSRPAVVVFDDRVWVIGQFTGGRSGQSEVLYSNDGNIWTHTTTFVPTDIKYSEVAETSFAFDNKIWISRSYTDRSSTRYHYKNDLWYSGLDSMNYSEQESQPVKAPSQQTEKDILNPIGYFLRVIFGNG